MVIVCCRLIAEEKLTHKLITSAASVNQPKPSRWKQKNPKQIKPGTVLFDPPQFVQVRTGAGA